MTKSKSKSQIGLPRKGSVDGKFRKDKGMVERKSMESFTVEVKDPRTAVLLLQSPEPLVIHQSVISLTYYCRKSSDNVSELLEYGALEKITKLISHEEICVKRFSGKLLAELCLSELACKTVLDDATVFSYILDMYLSDIDEVIQEFSSSIIASLLAYDPSLASQVLTDRVVETIFKRLVSTDPDILNNNLQILSRILNEYEASDFVIGTTWFNLDALLVLIKSLYVEIQKWAVLVLRSLVKSKNAKMINLLIEKNAVQHLFDIIGTSEWKDIHGEVLLSLTAMAEDANTSHLVLAYVLSIIAYIEAIQDPALEETALWCLAKLASSEEIREVLQNYKVVNVMCKMLKKEEQVVKPACEGLALMLQNRRAVESIIAENPFTDLLILIHSENISVKEAAANTLLEAAQQDRRICYMIADNKIVLVVYKIIEENINADNCDLVLKLLKVLGVIARHYGIREKMFGPTMMKTLINCMFPQQEEGQTQESPSFEQIQTEACLVLSLYLTELNIRQYFVANEGINKLIKCLKSKNIPLKMAAATLLQKACYPDAAIGKILVKSGILKFMIEQYTMRKISPAWENAIEVLFRCHLPSKFALTGRLDYSDITDDEFYVSTYDDKRLLMLEDLIQQELSSLRPIYVVKYKETDEADSSESLTQGKESSISIIKKESSFSLTERIANVEQGQKEEADVVHHSDRSSQVSSKRSTRSTKFSENVPSTKAKYGKCTVDVNLVRYVEELKEILGNAFISNHMKDFECPCLIEHCKCLGNKLIEERVRIVASFVSKKMAGPDPHRPCTSGTVEVHLSEIKIQLRSNVIPLGSIRIGSYFERAVLFKVLADMFGIPCCLVRGTNARAWIELSIPHFNTEDEKSESVPLTPERLRRTNCILDLMENPGRFMPIESYSARKYCLLPTN